MDYSELALRFLLIAASSLTIASRIQATNSLLASRTPTADCEYSLARSASPSRTRAASPGGSPDHGAHLREQAAIGRSEIGTCSGKDRLGEPADLGDLLRQLPAQFDEILAAAIVGTQCDRRQVGLDLLQDVQLSLAIRPQDPSLPTSPPSAFITKPVPTIGLNTYKLGKSAADGHGQFHWGSSSIRESDCGVLIRLPQWITG